MMRHIIVAFSALSLASCVEAGTIDGMGTKPELTEEAATLAAAPGITAALENHVPVTGLAGARASQKRYELVVPPGASNLRFEQSGGTGDADVYIRFAAPPTTSVWDYRPYVDGNDELVEPPAATAGTWHVMIRGYSAYTGVSLVAHFDDDGGGGPPGDAPPATWKEHWFEHEQNLQLHAYDDHVAIYFDSDVPGAGTQWILPFVSSYWQYLKQRYGEFGDDRLYSIHHQGKYGGGHPSTYFDDSHDHRNVSDCGPGPWQNEGSLDMVAHEICHVVEIASRGVHGSPAFGLWGDSKWAEFCQYDAYMAIGRTADAQRVYNMWINQSEGFPRANTYWFRDWFYPLWRDHGHGQVMANFFQLLAQHFPKSGQSYARDLNWGEYIHFMSGAAGKNLKAMATQAFGWPASWEQQFNTARAQFPGVTY